MKREASRRPRGSHRGLLALGVLGLVLLLFGGGAIALFASSSTGGRSWTSTRGSLDQAKILFADRCLAECEKMLRELLHNDSGDSKARVLLGRVLLERGRLAEAREAFGGLLKSDPKNLEAHRGLGAVLRGMGQHDLALLYLVRACELDPHNPAVWKERGMAERAKGDVAAALTSIQKSISLDSQQSDLAQVLSELATDSRPAAEIPGHPGNGGSDSPFPPSPDLSGRVPRPRAGRSSSDLSPGADSPFRLGGR